MVKQVMVGPQSVCDKSVELQSGESEQILRGKYENVEDGILLRSDVLLSDKILLRPDNMESGRNSYGWDCFQGQTDSDRYSIDKSINIKSK